VLAQVRERSKIEVATLPGMFGVSPETVRRDLHVLEAQGLVKRSYGLVYAVESGTFETDLRERAETNAEEKARIAEAAVACLGEAQSLFIDEGYNTQLIARSLPEGRPLTVVTASVPVALILVNRLNMRLILLGGRLRPNTLGIVDAWASDQLGNLTVDLAFMGANAVSIDRGMSTPDPAVAVIKRAAMRAAIRRVFIGAHHKFGLASFVRFADVSDFEVLITGRELSAAKAQAFRSAGVHLVRV
jgi:DeoR/GlpR family transcriptional regulator of sugar metabolism